MGRVELIPAALAVAGLGIQLVGSGWIVWQLTIVWVVILVSFAVLRIKFGLRGRPSVGVLVIALPVLFLTAWEGGWGVIPAAVAQLVIDARMGDRRPRGGVAA